MDVGNPPAIYWLSNPCKDFIRIKYMVPRYFRWVEGSSARQSKDSTACEVERVDLNAPVLEPLRSRRREPRWRIGVNPLQPPAENSEEPNTSMNSHRSCGTFPAFGRSPTWIDAALRNPPGARRHLPRAPALFHGAYSPTRRTIRPSWTVAPAFLEPGSIYSSPKSPGATARSGVPLPPSLGSPPG